MEKRRNPEKMHSTQINHITWKRTSLT